MGPQAPHHQRDRKRQRCWGPNKGTIITTTTTTRWWLNNSSNHHHNRVLVVWLTLLVLLTVQCEGQASASRSTNNNDTNTIIATVHRGNQSSSSSVTTGSSTIILSPSLPFLDDNANWKNETAEEEEKQQQQMIYDNETIIMDDYDEYEYDDSDYYYEEPQHALVYPWVVQLVGVMVFFGLHHTECRVPFAAVMFIVGLLMGVAAFRLDAPLTQFHNSIRMWSDIDSQVLLLVFLPGLIFRDAMDIDIPTFQQSFTQLWMLAFPMVLVGTVLTAIVVLYVLPSNTDIRDDFTWSLGLTVGSILASTDPVAVAAVLKQADAPPRLQMHIGGESMLNDGAAVVFYLIFSTQFLAELGLNDTTITWGDGILMFFRMSLGGVAVGFCFAMGLLLLLYELDRRLDPENNVWQVVAAVSTAYMSYYVSEQVCQMSGVIACVTCGVTTKALGGSRLLADPELMDTYLKLLENLLNTLLFTLGGTVFGEVIANSEERAHFTKIEWLSLFILYVSIMIIRAFQVLLFYPILVRVGLSTNWKEMAFFSFAGLRGAVGIALALALDRTVRQETTNEGSRALTSTVVGLAGGVSFLTLLINGSLAGWLLEKLGLTPPKASRKQVLQLFEMSARDFILHAFQKLRKKQPRFEQVPFPMVQDHVPFLAAVDQDYLDNLEDQNQSGLHKRFHRKNSHSRTFDEMQEVFTQPMARVVDDTTTLMNPDAAADPTCPEHAVQEVRQIFLKLLDAGYHAEVAHGGIHDDHGFTYETLHQSVVFTAKNCRAGEEPLQDWTYANSFAFHFDAQGYAEEVSQWFRRRFWKTKDQQRFDYVYQKQRSRVIRTLVFLEAHRRAEDEIKRYILGDTFRTSEGMAAADLESAILTVLDESQAQVQKAEEWLRTSVSLEDLNVIRSHYMVSILLHKLALYVEKAVQNGRLKETEGRLYLSQIKARSKKVRNCQSKHEEEPSSRRPKRQKQKSSASTSGTLDMFWNGLGGENKVGTNRGGRSRRKKQHSAPAESSFWDQKETNGRDLNQDDQPSSRPHPIQGTTSSGLTSDTLNSFLNAAQEDNQESVGTKGGGRSRRKKQQSAPAQSMFWNPKESYYGDDIVGRHRRSSSGQWSTCSNTSAPDGQLNQDDNKPSNGPQPIRETTISGLTSDTLNSFFKAAQGDKNKGAGTKGERSRRKKQQSAPAQSMFWNLNDSDGGGRGDDLGGRHRQSLSGQWSTCSNNSAPDGQLNQEDELNSCPQLFQDTTSSGLTRGTPLDSFWKVAQGGNKESVGTKGRSRRKKQHSAPAQSMFWNPKERDDNVGNGEEDLDGRQMTIGPTVEH
jgi:NhaP-type Na+/H+ or K+/H+ antiporter